MQKHYPRQLGKPLHLRRGMEGSCGVSPQSLCHEDPSDALATARATSPLRQALGTGVFLATLRLNAEVSTRLWVCVLRMRSVSTVHLPDCMVADIRC